MSEHIHNSDRITGSVGEARHHDSALKHVTGQARYVDDIAVPNGTLHLAVGGCDTTAGDIIAMNLDAVRNAPGVVAVLTADDIAGTNDVSPLHLGDDPILADKQVRFHGEAVFAVLAQSYRAARAAARLGHIETTQATPVVTVDEAMAVGAELSERQEMTRGDWHAALAAAPQRAQGTLRIGGQDHFYLEGQISLALPMEDGDVHIHCSTQHPTEVQIAVARVLGRAANAVTVEVRRMGGAFGGKETQAAQWAALAALGAVQTGRPVKCRLDRDDDMILTGKRHDFRADWQVGFDNDGRILGVDVNFAARCGCSRDLSDAVNDRAMFHFDNAYFFETVHISSARLRTNTVSNTAFRGFGGPQGTLAGERVIEAVARACGRDPLSVRKLNFYSEGDNRDLTPFHMKVEDFCLHELVGELETSSHYWARREAITAHNAANPVVIRGLALTPVKYGISFTTTALNQAGALIHVYKDGSVHLNHGGTEMGQGLLMKVAQIVAEELQIDIDRIQITSTHTGKVPNTSPTAASAGSDLNGMAARNAANTIKRRLIAFAQDAYGVSEDAVTFVPGRVRIGEHTLTFDELVMQAHLARVQLSATGFYRTPKIHYDRKAGSGRPFYYFAYGAAVAEVAIDTLTGENRVLAVDILHDVGRSLNPAIDLGQIEGGFVQGMGWLTTEELWWDETGRLKTHAPSTYKIPTSRDRPEHFNVQIWAAGYNREGTIHRSKAVGEPPLVLATCVHQAISDGLASLVDYQQVPPLDAPATPEAILNAIDDLRGAA